MHNAIAVVAGFDLRTLSPFACKAHFFITHFLSHLSSWTVAVLSTERALSIHYSFPREVGVGGGGRGGGMSGILSGRRRGRMMIAWLSVAACLVLVNSSIIWSVRCVMVIGS